MLLAHAPAAVQAEVLANLTRVTPYTISQPGTLRRQLARVLKDDYATTVEEMSLGACSVAVPIRARADVVASLGIVLPSLKKDQARLVAAMQVAARGIGRALVDPVDLRRSLPLNGRCAWWEAYRRPADSTPCPPMSSARPSASSVADPPD